MQFAIPHPSKQSRDGDGAPVPQRFTPRTGTARPAASNLNALKAVVEFWTALGAKVLILSPRTHDVLVGKSSHLPHITAATLALSVGPRLSPEQILLCGDGFRDATCIAEGSPIMWREIVLANRKNLIKQLRDFNRRLSSFEKALENEDSNAILDFFVKAKNLKAKLAGAIESQLKSRTLHILRKGSKAQRQVA